MQNQNEPFFVNSANRAPPVWLKVDAMDVGQSIGFFPAAWFTGPGSERDAILVRLTSQEYALFDAAALGELKRISLQGQHFVFLTRRWMGQHGAAFGASVESFACPLRIIKQFVELPDLRGAEIPYVDSVLPTSLDVRAVDLSLFLLDHVRPIPPLRCLQLPFARSSMTTDKLRDTSAAEYIFFQDADDVPCADRRDRLIAESISGNLDVVSCHELCVDEVQEIVRAVRFLDAFGRETSAQISSQSVSAPLSMMRRSALSRGGEIPSMRRVEQDAALLDRIAQQGLRVGSVDEYLLVRRRRRHAGA